MHQCLNWITQDTAHRATLGQGPTHNYPHLSAASCLGSQAPHAATLYLQTIYTIYISTLQHRATHGRYIVKGCKGPKKWSRNIAFADIMNIYRCLTLNLNHTLWYYIHPIRTLHHTLFIIFIRFYSPFRWHNVPFYPHPFFAVNWIRQETKNFTTFLCVCISCVHVQLNSAPLMVPIMPYHHLCSPW